MKIGRKALVLSFVHSNLAIKNLEVAVHEAKIDKDPDFKILSTRLKKLQDAFDHTFVQLNKKMARDGVDMEKVEEELLEYQDITWSNPIKEEL